MLTLEEENRRRNILRSIIFMIAEKQDVLSDNNTVQTIFNELNDIYSDGLFRHYYSDIYSYITAINEDTSKGNTEILSQNLLYIKENMWPFVHENTYNSVRKLYDHSNLDIARINYVKAIDGRNRSSSQQLTKNMQLLNNQYSNFQSSVDDTRKDIGELYANILTIMGIFVAVFSFIAVNSNITFELTQANQADVFWGIIKINIFVAVCIITLLLTLKFFIIKPLLRDKK